MIPVIIDYSEREFDAEADFKEPQIQNAIKTFQQYAHDAIELASYPDFGNNLLYPALGLAGEAGEAVDKIKKIWRNKGITSAKFLSTDDKDALVKEIGDVLWYIAALAYELEVPLSVVAGTNIAKLQDRSRRNVIKSEGDNR